MSKNYFNEKEDKILLSNIYEVLSAGEVFFVKNPTLNKKIKVNRGNGKKGLVHLISHRTSKWICNDISRRRFVQAKKRISAILFLAIKNIEKIPVKDENGNYSISFCGIKTILSKYKNEYYFLTGFDDFLEEAKVMNATNAVIARYGNSKEFMAMHSQVTNLIIKNQEINNLKQKNQNLLIENKKLHGQIRKLKKKISSRG